MIFKPVTPQVNFPELEKAILSWWYESGIVQKYLKKNTGSKKRFSFLDGPITANNPMGIHHAWGRTYKDLWQRYHTLRGKAGRYQNGFDCQGLWVEVEVEKELGFKTKKDIESYGIANFVNKCKERVSKYSLIQTEQSKRLGYFMDWENSYYTMSDSNNYAIWNYLKTVWQKGWLYKGRESIPWCPRCETAISQHEMLTEDYKTVTHESVYLKLPLTNRPGECLLVWTTTPWTIPANIAVAIDLQLQYSLIDGCWVAAEAGSRIFKGLKAQKTASGKDLVGLKYLGPYDSLPAVQAVSSHPLFHTVIATDSRILPITPNEGTGLVHTAVSAGEEDFKLGRKLGLPMIPVIADNADYLPDLGNLSGQNAKKHPEIILHYLKSKGWVLRTEPYTHRYPACWRCKTELVWKVADEWYIAMDKPDPFDPKRRTYRQQMISVAKKIKWLPSFGKERELDWLRNMHDWLISKKNRYWGLALPIYECHDCQKFEVVGGREELQARAVSGWENFTGHSPHRPWVDEVKLACSGCGRLISRITDVGNPWLDAGIVPFSTLPKDWFPADFITESFPGQFKNWFYALIAMSTALVGTPPFKTVLGFATMLDSHGKPFHKSAGNAIEFVEGADKFGADVIRWICSSGDPAQNILFGQKQADDVRRNFFLILWNVYNFFVTYANVDGYRPVSSQIKPSALLDKWILLRLNQTVHQVTTSLDKFDPLTPTRSISSFVSDLSLWYVRRSRDRVGPTAQDSKDKLACHSTLHQVLTTLAKLLAPFTPFISEEIYKNLSMGESVHLSSWPKFSKLDPSSLQIIEKMRQARKIVELGLSQRKRDAIKVRQPLRSLTVKGLKLNPEYACLIQDELNVKEVIFDSHATNELVVELDKRLDPELVAEGQIRELIRQVQDKRKELGARLDQKITITLPNPPSDQALLQELARQTLAADIKSGSDFKIELI